MCSLKGTVHHLANTAVAQMPQSVSAAAGERLFQQLNCAACHTPVMFTGANPIAALAHKRVALYSDLLLHDMGRLGDGIVQGTATLRAAR